MSAAELGIPRRCMISARWLSTVLALSFNSKAISLMFLPCEIRCRICFCRMQYRDRLAVNGMLMGIFLGSFTFALRQVLDGKELPQDPRVYFAEGLDRSGVFGWL